MFTLVEILSTGITEMYQLELQKVSPFVEEYYALITRVRIAGSRIEEKIEKIVPLKEEEIKEIMPEICTVAITITPDGKAAIYIDEESITINRWDAIEVKLALSEGDLKKLAKMIKFITKKA